jgi:hypothetical protein
MATVAGQVGVDQDALAQLSDPFPGMNVKPPDELGDTPVTAVEDQFYGDRTGQFVDPFGHRWSVATHVEDVPPEDMEKRAAEAMGAGSA